MICLFLFYQPRAIPVELYFHPLQLFSHVPVTGNEISSPSNALVKRKLTSFVISLIAPRSTNQAGQNEPSWLGLVQCSIQNIHSSVLKYVLHENCWLREPSSLTRESSLYAWELLVAGQSFFTRELLFVWAVLPCMRIVILCMRIVVYMRSIPTAWITSYVRIVVCGSHHSRHKNCHSMHESC